jgi:signal transduction histidine kinase
MDISAFAARAAGYIVLTMILILGYLAALTVVSQFLPVTKFQMYVPYFIITVLAITIPSFERGIRTWTERIFYQKPYETHEVLLTCTNIMATTIDLTKLSHGILTVLFETLHHGAATIIIPTGKNDFLIESVPELPRHYKLLSEELQLLSADNTVVVCSTLPNSEKKTIMRRCDIDLFLPLNSEGRTVGYLLLSEKSSGDVYTHQDIQFLTILAPQLAIALANSEHYEEIKQFNITLKEEIEKATRELSLANIRLEEVDRLKDDFISVASHDLRTPMNSIKGYLWLILKNKDELPEKVRERLRRIYISSERMIALINDMLNISRIESGRIELVPEQLRVCEEVSDVIEELRSQATDRSITLLSDCSCPFDIIADRNKFHEILLNLVNNAIKFTPNAGIVKVTTHDEGTSVRIAIIDSGIGICKEDIPRLFSKFVQLSQVQQTIPNLTGTGLGLYICKKLVGLMNGTIGCESEIGHGSTFWFTLPKKS